jgi:C_GCAxxG_C_C family probable redox protein
MREPNRSLTPVEVAVSRFRQDLNCSQSVLVAFAPLAGLREDQALRLGLPFGGGVARRGQVCGAVSGALMVLGLKMGADTPSGKEAAYQMAQDFLARFEALHGSILCRDLVGFEILTPEGRQKARDKGVFENLCPRLVGDAARIVQVMMEKHP